MLKQMTLSDNLEKMDGQVNSEYQYADIIQKISERKVIRDVDELTNFLSTCNLEVLQSLSMRIRNYYDLNPKVITYSRKVFINLVNLCKDSCSYCTYKKEPEEAEAVMLLPSQVF